jgi:L-alanine-DL-glutamate epimerase-like enolase superfamily enzyme
VKIRAVRSTPLAVPLAQAYHWRSGADTTANLVLVTVDLSEGASGYGEVVCNDPILAARAADALAELMIGETVTDVERLLQTVATRGRWRVTRRHTNQLLSGLEAACWDAAGKTLQVPASTFLGGRLRTQVDFFGFVQGDAPSDVGAHAHELVAHGHSVLYLKVGLGRERDLARVEAVRTAIGDGPLLRVDANEAWDVPTAVDTIRELEPFRVDWVEQPISGDNVPKLARVRRDVSTKIAADNAVYSPGELRTVLEADAADAVVLSPHESGGLWSFGRMAYLAQTFGVPVNRKGYLESSISTFAALQALAGIPNLTSGNQLTHQLLAESLTTTRLDPREGLIEIPAEPGLGFELDQDAVARASRRATAGH